ncbi:hypothetical protein D3C76_1672150 [compost metagenome]
MVRPLSTACTVLPRATPFSPSKLLMKPGACAAPKVGLTVAGTLDSGMLWR